MAEYATLLNTHLHSPQLKQSTEDLVLVPPLNFPDMIYMHRLSKSVSLDSMASFVIPFTNTFTIWTLAIPLNMNRILHTAVKIPHKTAGIKSGN